jgi:hypothetical protein
MIIHKIEPDGKTLYLQFQYHKPSVQKLQDLRTRFGKKKINWSPELEGWVFDKELLYEVKELFSYAYIYDDDLREEYERVYKIEQPKKVRRQIIERRKSDILKLF